MGKRTDPQSTPSEQELARLGRFLDGCNGGKAMSLEQVDGFFCALIAGPSLVPPSEYHPLIFGQTSPEDVIFADLHEANEIFQLLMALWNEIAGTLLEGRDYVPIIFEYEDGSMPANEWAVGFHRGIRMRADEWTPFIEDEELGGLIGPVLTLSLEHSDDPQAQTLKRPISVKARERLIGQMADALLPMYQFFRERERGEVAKAPAPPVSAPKVGRNESCPCGSGKKYKKCCGNKSVH